MKIIFILLAFTLYLNADVINESIVTWDFSNSEYTLIDVRMPSEYEQTGVVENAVLITVINPNSSINANFINEIEKFLDKNDKIAIMCKSGNRSLMAAKILEKAGFKHLVNLTGGMDLLQRTNIKLVPYKK